MPINRANRRPFVAQSIIRRSDASWAHNGYRVDGLSEPHAMIPAAHAQRASPPVMFLVGQDIYSSQRRTAAFRKAASAGIEAGLPARWPQMLGIGVNSACARWALSNSLSATRK